MARARKAPAAESEQDGTDSAQQETDGGPKVLTEYVVQRRYDGDGELFDGMPDDLWIDVGRASGHSGTNAIRRHVNGLEELAAGEYRAFPVRSDSRVSVAVEVKPVPLFTVPTVAPTQVDE